MLVPSTCPGRDAPYLDISRVETLIPRHSNTIKPVTAIAARTRGRETNVINALHGGNLDLADFQFTPPFGSNILNDCAPQARSELLFATGGRLYWEESLIIEDRGSKRVSRSVS